MDPDFEDQCNVENTGAWSGSSSSQEDDSIPDLRPECCSINAVNFPKASTSLIPQSDREPFKCCETDEHVSEGEEDASYWEQEDDKSESSLDPDMTRTSGPHLEQGEAGNSHIGGTGSQRVQSSSGGGSSDVAPACVSFGISEEGAEPAQRWDSGSDTALCRPNQHRARHTRLSQSERHVKETKSKCKRIALLLTHAPNPCNKGALLFKKRRQRVEKYTFTSYGTGENKSTNNKTEEAEDLSEYNFVSTSDSELEEEYSVHQPQFENCCNWKSQHEMEGLPATQGKGALMFAQRRKRMDEIESENEELRSKGIPVEGLLPESESKPPTTIHEPKELHYLPIDVSSPQNNYSEEPVDYQDTSNVPSSLVPNRTAKPFLGFHVNAPPARHSVIMPVTPVKKKSEPKFKVPVPVPSNITPHVWSPTSDIIASRDERISVPAIKTCILPEAKRKGASKQSPPQQKANLQNKDDRRSFIEYEEDCFSLGAEACNFMQPKTIKLKNPPPVAPKPTINSACPPWMVKSDLNDPYVSPQPSSTGPHSHDRAKPLQMANHWAQDQTTAVGLQMSTNLCSPLHAQPTTNSFSLQQSRSPVSMQACPPTYSPQPPPPSNAPNSIASYPLQTEKMCRAQTGTMAGRGAELFAKRQTRMEKFVFDAESKKVSQPRAPSPAASLPNTWRYSSNIRAPPPLAYNPLLAPFYPPAAAKQPPSTSPKIKSKQTKAKPKQATKHLNALDIMKHQPYHLDSSLFKYEKVIETKAPSPSASPSPKPSPTPTKPRPRKLIKHISQNETSKSLGLGSSPVSAESKIPKSPDVLKVDNMELKLSTSASPVFNHISKQVANNRPASTTSQHSSLSSISDNLAAAFSPASLIARGVRQMAPRPKFSAKKQEAEGKQWKPVAMLH